MRWRGAAASSRSRWRTSRRAAGGSTRRAGSTATCDQVGDALDAAGVRARGDLRRVVRRPDRRRVCRAASGSRRRRSCWCRRCRRRGARRARALLPARAAAAVAAVPASRSLRMYREIAAASDGVVARRAAPRCATAGTVLTHMFSPGRMARRVHLLAPDGPAGELARVERADARRHRRGRARPRRAGAADARVPARSGRTPRRVDAARAPGHLGLITRPDGVRRHRRAVRRASARTRDSTEEARWLTSFARSRAGRARSKRCSTRRAATPRAAVVFAHPLPTAGRHDAHEGGVPGRQGAGAHRLRRPALQLPRRRPQRRRLGRRARRDGRLPGGGRLHGRRSIRASRSGRPGSRSARTSR